MYRYQGHLHVILIELDKSMDYIDNFYWDLIIRKYLNCNEV